MLGKIETEKNTPEQYALRRIFRSSLKSSSHGRREQSSFAIQCDLDRRKFWTIEQQTLETFAGKQVS
jgi:hypothetical protein